MAFIFDKVWHQIPKIDKIDKIDKIHLPKYLPR